ncbi:hypothetical protein HBB16_01630 [Pseudonocardia sp. MCCB 268]|nr:hypothetical protein [Pseudonocardia cytotoxica]
MTSYTIPTGLRTPGTATCSAPTARGPGVRHLAHRPGARTARGGCRRRRLGPGRRRRRQRVRDDRSGRPGRHDPGRTGHPGRSGTPRTGPPRSSATARPTATPRSPGGRRARRDRCRAVRTGSRRDGCMLIGTDFAAPQAGRAGQARPRPPHRSPRAGALHRPNGPGAG